MKLSFRLAAALAALFAVAACTNSGIDPSGLQPLRAEQAAAIAPPPPGSGVVMPGSPQQFPPPAGSQGAAQLAPAPQTMTPQAPALQTPAPQTPAPQTIAQPKQAAAINTPARIQFAPVVGATPDSVAPLAARLNARAAQRGIAVAQAGGAGTTHVLKGYFSAFSEQNQTTVIYVWDVLDPAGNRLHRIQGQQKVSGAAGQGWSGVAPQTMEAIADRTIDDLATWLVSRAG